MMSLLRHRQQMIKVDILPNVVTFLFQTSSADSILILAFAIGKVNLRDFNLPNYYGARFHVLCWVPLNAAY